MAQRRRPDLHQIWYFQMSERNHVLVPSIPFDPRRKSVQSTEYTFEASYSHKLYFRYVSYFITLVFFFSSAFFLNLITPISEYFYRPFQELNLYINFIIIITLKSEHLSRKHHILYIPLAEGPLILYIYVVEWPKVAKIPVSEEEEMVRNI